MSVFGGQGGGDGVDGVALAGDDDAGRAIDGGDGDFDKLSLRGIDGNRALYLGLTRRDGDHGAILGQGAHEPATGRNQFHAIFQAKDPGHTGRRHFAHTVADEESRLYTHDCHRSPGRIPGQRAPVGCRWCRQFWIFDF